MYILFRLRIQYSTGRLLTQFISLCSATERRGAYLPSPLVCTYSTGVGRTLCKQPQCTLPTPPLHCYTQHLFCKLSTVANRMPPKNKSLEDMVAGITSQLESISEQLREISDRQDRQDTKLDKLDRLETLLEATRKENEDLKKENATMREELNTVKERLNSLEQRNRADCVRIFDLPISGDSSDNNIVAKQVYQKLLLPILAGAQQKGRLAAVPKMEDVIETAHILPGPKADKPIICRIKKGPFKLLIHQHKKEFSPRAPGRGDRPGLPLYAIFDDITRDAYSLMKKIKSDARVQAAWFAGGAIRLRLTNSETIRRVYSIYGPYEDIFASN